MSGDLSGVIDSFVSFSIGCSNPEGTESLVESSVTALQAVVISSNTLAINTTIILTIPVVFFIQ